MNVATNNATKKETGHEVNGITYSKRSCCVPRLKAHMTPPKTPTHGMLFACVVPLYGNRVSFGGHVFHLYEKFYTETVQVSVYLCDGKRCTGTRSASGSEGNHRKFSLRIVTFNRSRQKLEAQNVACLSRKEIAIYHFIEWETTRSPRNFIFSLSANAWDAVVSDDCTFITLQLIKPTFMLAAIAMNVGIFGCPRLSSIPLVKTHPSKISYDGLAYRMKMPLHRADPIPKMGFDFCHCRSSQIHSKAVWKHKACYQVVPEFRKAAQESADINQAIYVWKFLGIPTDTAQIYAKKSDRYAKKHRLVFSESRIRRYIREHSRSSQRRVAYIWKYVIGSGSSTCIECLGSREQCTLQAKYDVLFYYQVVTVDDVLGSLEKRSVVDQGRAQSIEMIRRIKTRHSLSYREMAEQIGISPATLSLWINNKADISKVCDEKIQAWIESLGTLYCSCRRI